MYVYVFVYIYIYIYIYIYNNNELWGEICYQSYVCARVCMYEIHTYIYLLRCEQEFFSTMSTVDWKGPCVCVYVYVCMHPDCVYLHNIYIYIYIYDN